MYKLIRANMVKVPKWFAFDLKAQRANIHYNKDLYSLHQNRQKWKGD